MDKVPLRSLAAFVPSPTVNTVFVARSSIVIDESLPAPTTPDMSFGSDEPSNLKSPANPFTPVLWRHAGNPIAPPAGTKVPCEIVIAEASTLQLIDADKLSAATEPVQAPASVPIASANTSAAAGLYHFAAVPSET